MATVINRRWLAAVAGGVALAVAGTGAPAATAQDEHANTQEVLNKYLSVGGPGAAVYAGNGDESWTLTAGTAKFGQNRPIAPDDHFRIASQTKTVVSAVVLQLMDEGKVELDAPIERYLPGVVTGNYDGNAITVRQLMQHTSGLARDPLNAPANPDGTYELGEMVASAMSEPPLGEPGGDVHYSNVGYHVLGLLIEEITGQSVGDAISERIIEPLGLENTSFPAQGERALAEPFVSGYTGSRVPPFEFWLDNTTSVEPSYWSSAAGMTSTLEDSTTFFRALLDGEVVSEAALAEMRTTVPTELPGPMGLGGNEVELSCGGTYWAKNGGLPGFISTTGVTDDGRFASVVTNTFSETAAVESFKVLDAALCD